MAFVRGDQGGREGGLVRGGDGGVDFGSERGADLFEDTPFLKGGVD